MKDCLHASDGGLPGGGAVLDGFERVTFANPETGYTIARIAPERGSGVGAELVTAVGPLLGAQVGEFLRLRGRWSSHPKYGLEFEVHSYATVPPATAAGIQKYLGSGLIKGIGPVMAERMAHQHRLLQNRIPEKMISTQHPDQPLSRRSSPLSR